MRKYETQRFVLKNKAQIIVTIPVNSRKFEQLV